MIWFTLVFAVLSYFLFLKPEIIQQTTQHMVGMRDNKQARRLLIIPLIALGWLCSRLIEAQVTSADAVALGFVVTSIVMLLPKLRFLVIPSALLTVSAFVLTMVLK